jgi:alpha-mannosidase
MTSLILICSMQLLGQTDEQSKIEFRNAPVLLREDGELHQQVLATCRADHEGRIQFSCAGKELLAAAVKKGENKYLLTVPAVDRPKEIVVSVKIDDSEAGSHSVTVAPPRKWEVYLVQHSHTDIGYTQPQADVLPRHLQYIDKVLEYCDRTDQLPDDARFRWTCESAWVVMEYLRSRPESQIERLKRRIREGRVEVTAMHTNMTELLDENTIYDYLKPLRELTRLGIAVKTAMQNDINGIAWCMPDYFRGTGVRYLDMGVNETRSILPFNQPTCFWWEAPSGERMLAFHADHYHIGNILGAMGDRNVWSLRLLWYLSDRDRNGYPFDRISLQMSGFYADNSPPSLAMCDVVQQWNSKYVYPKLRLSTASEFFEYVEGNYSDNLAVHRNAWLDWWSDGVGSSSRETAEIRKVQNRKQADEGLCSMLSMLGVRLGSGLRDKVDRLNESVMLFDEHTWGAGESVDNPFSENTTRQWMQKGSFAWEAVKSEALLHEEIMGRLEGHFGRTGFPVIYVVNPMGWKRSGHVQVFVDHDVSPVRSSVRIIDLETGNEAPSQIVHERGDGMSVSLEVSDVPAFGWKVFRIEPGGQIDGGKLGAGGNVGSIESPFYKLVIDRATGAISSMYDKELKRELADPRNPWKVGQVVRETIPNRDTLQPSHSTVSNVRIVNGADGQVWESIRVSADMEGLEKGTAGAPKGMELELRLYKNVKKIELKYTVRKAISTDPEALYVAFPFYLPDSKIVFETTGATLAQGQQLPGSASDWNVAQNFVSVRGRDGQISVVSNEVPLWQFGDFNLGKYERFSTVRAPWLYSWVMNNYWMTNFRAFQEGAFSWTYQISSTSDTSNAFAAKYSWGERNAFPARSFAAGKQEGLKSVLETLQVSGSKNAIVVNCRPMFEEPENSLLLHIRELDGQAAEVRVSSGVPNCAIRGIWEVDSLGHVIGRCENGIGLKPFEVKFVKVVLSGT